MCTDDLQAGQYCAWRMLAPNHLPCHVLTRRCLLLLPCSVFETVRFIPPLNVTGAEVDEALGVFGDALSEVVASK